MKKYKLLNAKNIFIGLGATTAIVAPVTTLVACGGNASNKNVDINGAVKAADTSLINKVMFQSYSGFDLNAEFVAENVFNSDSEGILENISRSFDIGEASLFGIINQQQYINKIIGSKKPVLEYEVSKSQINKDNGFGNIATDFVSKIDKTKHYFSTVTKLVGDDSVTNGIHESGKWKISLYEQDASFNADITSAISILKDSNKFAVDEAQVKSMGGTYSMATKHIFAKNGTPGESGRTIVDSKVTSKGSLHDRANEENMKSWTSYGPKGSLSQSDQDLVNKVKITAYPEENRKTHEWYIVLSITDVATGLQVKTEYIKADVIGKFDSSTPLDLQDLKTQLKVKTGFMKFYDFMQESKASLGILPNTTMPHFIKLASELPTMASVMDLVGDDNFLNDVFAFISKTSPNFDKNTFYRSLKNMEDKPFESPQDWGAKRYSVLYFTGQFYSLVHQFMDSADGAKYVSLAKAVTSADDFYKSAVDEKDWNEFVKTHQSFYDDLVLKNPSMPRNELRAKIEELEWNTIIADPNNKVHNSIVSANDSLTKLSNNIILKNKVEFNGPSDLFALGLKITKSFNDIGNNHATKELFDVFKTFNVYSNPASHFNESYDVILGSASEAGVINWTFDKKSFDQNTGILTLNAIVKVAYKDANGSHIASKEQTFTVSGFKTLQEIADEKAAAETKAYADYLHAHAAAVTALALTDTTDKAATKLAIEYYEFEQAHKAQIDAAITSLAIASTDIASHKQEILTEAKKILMGALSHIQDDIDAHRGQAGWKLPMTESEINSKISVRKSTFEKYTIRLDGVGTYAMKALIDQLKTYNPSIGPVWAAIRENNADYVIVDIELFDGKGFASTNLITELQGIKIWKH